MSNNNIINSIVISADHAGFELKNELKAFLSENYPEIKIIDAGAFEYDAEGKLQVQRCGIVSMVR